MACCAVELTGWIFLVALGLKLVHDFYSFIYTTILGSLLGRSIDLRKCGPWAAVTGATDGIGKSYAMSMAAAGLNVVLISRTEAKLKEVADEIKAKHSSVDVKTIAVNFTEGQSIYAKLRSELNKLKVGVLVNNVGTADGNRYDWMPEESVHDLVNCNIMSMTRMCHLILPQMIERKSGVIINIGSLSSATATPYLTLYGASKAFVDKFSQDLAAEVRPHGVIIQTVHPGFVHTKLARFRRSSFFVPDPDAYVKAALRTLGLENRTAGYWVHKIQLYFSDLANFFIPRHLVEKIAIKGLKKTLGMNRKRREDTKSR